MLSYDVILTKLEEIEEDFAERQAEWEEVGEQRTRVKRDWEYLWAKTYALTDDGRKVAERQADTLLAIAGSGNPLYDEKMVAEARWAALKGALDVLGERARVLQSMLKAQTREQGPQPAWSRTAA